MIKQLFFVFTKYVGKLGSIVLLFFPWWRLAGKPEGTAALAGLCPAGQGNCSVAGIFILNSLFSFGLAILTAVHLEEIFQDAHHPTTRPVLVLTELSAVFRLGVGQYAGVAATQTPSCCRKPVTCAHPGALAGWDLPGAAAGEGSWPIFTSPFRACLLLQGHFFIQEPGSKSCPSKSGGFLFRVMCYMANKIWQVSNWCLGTACLVVAECKEFRLEFHFM